MNKAISKLNSEHFEWGEKCDGWHLIKSQGLSIVEEKMPKGSSEREHYHKKAHQFFYILVGVATISIESNIFTIHQGEGIEVKPGQIHKFTNQSDSEVQFIVTSAPSTTNDRYETE